MGISSVSIKNDETIASKQEKVPWLTQALGYGAIFGSNFCINNIYKKLNQRLCISIDKNLNSIYEYNAASEESLTKAMKKMYEESGLAQRGVKIFDYKDGIWPDALLDILGGKGKEKPVSVLYTPEELEEFAKKHPRKYKRQLKKEMKMFDEAIENFRKYGTNNESIIMAEKHPKLFKILCRINGYNLFKYLQPVSQVLCGQNAYANKNKVHINSKVAMNLMLPHELGHVKNNINLGFGKFLQKFRNVSAITRFAPLLILGTAVFRDKKGEGEQSDTIMGKGLDFIKDNCVGLAAATQVPVLAEEGLASAKGLKMIKNYVKPNEFKMFRGIMGKAWLTYLCGAVACTGTVYAANSIKNFFSPAKSS